MSHAVFRYGSKHTREIGPIRYGARGWLFGAQSLPSPHELCPRLDLQGRRSPGVP